MENLFQSQLAYSKVDTHHSGLTWFGASLAQISTMIGAGIVGIPFSFNKLGIPFAFLVNCFMFWCTKNSCRLYFRSMELTGGLESLSEIGYKLLGRFSIFLINGMVLLNCLGGLIAYNNIFGNICVSIYKNIFDDYQTSFFGDSRFYILILIVLIMPVIFKRTVGELKLVSIVLFVSVFVFVLTLMVYLIEKGTSLNMD